MAVRLRWISSDLLDFPNSPDIPAVVKVKPGEAFKIEVHLPFALR